MLLLILVWFSLVGINVQGVYLPLISNIEGNALKSDIRSAHPPPVSPLCCNFARRGVAQVLL
jgi:hypothetical protein